MDTFSDYVDLDKNACSPQVQPRKALVPKPRPLSKVLSNPASEPVQDNALKTIQVTAPKPAQNTAPKPVQNTAPKPVQIPRPKPVQIPGPKPVPNPGPDPLPKPVGLKPRTVSQVESIPEHERTSSYGSSDGTDGSSSVTGGSSSVKSLVGGFDKRDCYENVQPPVCVEVSRTRLVGILGKSGLTG